MNAVWIALIAVFAALIPILMLAQQKKAGEKKTSDSGDAGTVLDTSPAGARDPGQHHHLGHGPGHHGGGHHDGGGHDGGGSDGGGGGGGE